MRFGIVCALLGLAACAGPEAGSDRPIVVATTTQVGSIAQELGADAIELTVLLEPGVEAHDFALRPEHAAALERADLLLLSGAALESWLDDAVEGAGVTERVRDLSDGIELRTAGEDEPAHTGEGEHVEGGVDPHYWLSGPNAVLMVENARAALVELAPTAAAAIDERAASLRERIEDADAEARLLIGEIPQERRRIVTDHDALGYFIEEYGLTFVGSIFTSLDVSSEPSARDLEVLVAEIRDAGVTAIFTESSVNPRLARAIAEESGARLVDEPLYTDSLGPADSGADTLDGVLRHNAQVIHDGLTGG